MAARTVVQALATGLSVHTIAHVRAPLMHGQARHHQVTAHWHDRAAASVMRTKQIASQNRNESRAVWRLLSCVGLRRAADE